MFIGRELELNTLNKLYRSDQVELKLLLFKGNISCYKMLLKYPLTLENTKVFISEISLIVSLILYTHAGYFLRVDCNKAEEELKTTTCSECALNALAIDEPLEYARLYLNGNLQILVDAEDSLELW